MAGTVSDFDQKNCSGMVGLLASMVGMKMLLSWGTFLEMFWIFEVDMNEVAMEEENSFSILLLFFLGQEIEKFGDINCVYVGFYILIHVNLIPPFF